MRTAPPGLQKPDRVVAPQLLRALRHQLARPRLVGQPLLQAGAQIHELAAGRVVAAADVADAQGGCNCQMPEKSGRPSASARRRRLEIRPAVGGPRHARRRVLQPLRVGWHARRDQEPARLQASSCAGLYRRRRRQSKESCRSAWSIFCSQSASIAA